jgi:hypothetical protein
MKEAIRRVRALLVVVDLRTQRAARERVLLVTLDSDNATAFDVRDPGARVLAVQRATAPHLRAIRHDRIVSRVPRGHNRTPQDSVSDTLVPASQAGSPQTEHPCRRMFDNR